MSVRRCKFIIIDQRATPTFTKYWNCEQVQKHIQARLIAILLIEILQSCYYYCLFIAVFPIIIIFHYYYKYHLLSFHISIILNITVLIYSKYIIILQLLLCYYICM